MVAFGTIQEAPRERALEEPVCEDGVKRSCVWRWPPLLRIFGHCLVLVWRVLHYRGVELPPCPPTSSVPQARYLKKAQIRNMCF
jgi:hypothetical protein